jgi:hypothetical protein
MPTKYKYENVMKWRKEQTAEYNVQQRNYQKKQYHTTDFSIVKRKKTLADYYLKKELERFRNILIDDV